MGVRYYRTQRLIALVSALTAVFVVTGPAAATDVEANASQIIQDDDDAVIVYIDNVVIEEASGEAIFTLSKPRRTQRPVVIEYVTVGTQATAGVDFVERKGTVTLDRKKDSSATVAVPIIDDAVDEPDEEFELRIAGPPWAALSAEAGIGTIVDDDTAGVTVEAADGVFVIEGEDPDTISVSLESEPAATVTVAPLTDTTQLTVSPTELRFEAGNWSEPQVITIAAIDDDIDEEDPLLVPIELEISSDDEIYDAIQLEPLMAAIGDRDSLLLTIEGPAIGAPAYSSTFTATVNAGGSGVITYEWEAFKGGNSVATGDEADFTFVPEIAGSYIVRAVATDDRGQSPAEFIEFTVLGDVSDSRFVADIVWLANEEITLGCNPPANDMFCPHDQVTRGQMAAFLVRFLGLTDAGGGNKFVDDDGSIFENDIAKLATAGITTGCNPEGTRYCPDGLVTRGQMAAFLHRANALAGS